MTASQGMSAGALESYHGEGREDYYTKDAGTWLGKGAETLGLTGTVNKNDFKAICAGVDPNNLSQTLVAGKIEGGVERRRGGNDLTFSTPKSMSIAMAAGDTKMQEIHNAAVSNVVTYIQEHYSHARTPDGYQSTGNIVAAKFDHGTNRNLDPNLHSHVVLANMTLTDDGRWRANDPKAIYQDQKALGQLYRNELITSLQKEGYGVEISNRGETIFEIKGVDPELVKQFSSRRAEVVAKVDEWKQAGMHNNLTEAKLYEKASLESRHSKQNSLTQEDIKKSWENGFKEGGTTKAEIMAAIYVEKENAKPVSPIHLDVKEKTEGVKVQKSAPSNMVKENAIGKLSAEDVITIAIKATHATDAVFGRTTVIANAAKFDTGNHSLEELNNKFSDMQERGTIAKIDEQKGVGKFSTKEMIEIEKNNIDKINAFEGTYKPQTDKIEVETYIRSWEHGKGYSLSGGQKDAIIKELTGTHGSLAVQGDPGTGKTTIAEVVEKFNTDVLQKNGRNNHVIGIAYTGKAAQELSETLGRDASTIDSFLNSTIQVVSKEEYSQYAKPMDKGHNGGSKNITYIPAGANVTLKLDEASFVGAVQKGQIIDKLSEIQEAIGSNNTVKLAEYGDTKQKQSISAGASFGQVLKDTTADTVELKQINRQKDRKLLSVAIQFNTGKTSDAQSAFDRLNNQGKVTEINDKETLLTATVEKYFDLKGKDFSYTNTKGEQATVVLKSVIVATGTNVARTAINEGIRNERIERNEIDHGTAIDILTPVNISAKEKHVASAYKVGQEIQFTGSKDVNGKLRQYSNIKNGTAGVITGIDQNKNTIKIQLKDGNERSFDLNKIGDKISVADREQRNFSVGDSIICLQNNKSLGVKNGQLGTVKEIDDKGIITASIGGKDINLGGYNKFDHGYAATVEKAQGATVDAVIHHADRDTTYNSANVAITRARYEAVIMTNDAGAYRNNLATIEKNDSTIDYKIGETTPTEKLKSDLDRCQEQVEKNSGNETDALQQNQLNNDKREVTENQQEVKEKSEIVSTDVNESKPNDFGVEISKIIESETQHDNGKSERQSDQQTVAQIDQDKGDAFKETDAKISEQLADEKEQNKEQEADVGKNEIVEERQHEIELSR